MPLERLEPYLLVDEEGKPKPPKAIRNNIEKPKPLPKIKLPGR